MPAENAKNATRSPARRFQLPPLELLNGFEAAARRLSFTEAAHELNLTQSAISRQIQALEAHLGVALFVRHNRSLALTEPGRQLLDVTSRCLDALRDVTRRLRTEPDDLRLSVTCTPGFASLWLIPRLARFTDANPDVDVRIAATNEVLDMERDDIAVAVRYCAQDAAAGSLLFGERTFPVCAPGLRDDPRRPLHAPEDLARHVILTLDDPYHREGLFDWEPWLRAMQVPDLRPARTIRYSLYYEVIAAAVGGQGVAMGRLPLLADLLREGRLVPAFPGREVGPRAYYVVENANDRNRPAVRAFVDWLHDEARQESARAGQAPKEDE